MKKFSIYLLMVIFLVIFLKSKETDQGSVKAGYTAIELKLRKTLEIDSSKLDKMKPPFFSSARKSSKNNRIFIQTWRPDLKIYCFDNGGVFINSFLTKGEGPGELLTLDSYQVLADSIIVSSNNKSIVFNIDGNMKEESVLKKYSYFCFFVDNNRYICNLTDRDASGNPVRNLVLLDKNREEILTSFCKDEKRKDIGVTMVLNSQLYHPLITPDYKFVYLPGSKRLVCAVSDGNIMYLKDLKGKIIKQVKIAFDPKSLKKEDRDKLLETFKDLERFPALLDGFKKKIPEKILTIMYLKLLPNDNFAVFLGTGFQKYEIQVFDRELNYICNLNFPESIHPRIHDLGRINFFEKGFFVIENNGEENRYVEYRIENFQQIFK